jgi:hypothetical protein
VKITAADRFVRDSLRAGDIIRNGTFTRVDDSTERHWCHTVTGFGRDHEGCSDNLVYTTFDDGVDARYGSWMSFGNIAAVLDQVTSTVERGGVIIWANGKEVSA